MSTSRHFYNLSDSLAAPNMSWCRHIDLPLPVDLHRPFSLSQLTLTSQQHVAPKFPPFFSFRHRDIRVRAQLMWILEFFLQM